MSTSEPSLIKEASLSLTTGQVEGIFLASVMLGILAGAWAIDELAGYLKWARPARVAADLAGAIAGTALMFNIFKVWLLWTLGINWA